MPETRQPLGQALLEHRGPRVSRLANSVHHCDWVLRNMLDVFVIGLIHGVEKGWRIRFRNVLRPRWMRQDATLMLNQSLAKDAVQCRACHASKVEGIMPFDELGYPPARAQDLRQLPEPKMVVRALAAAGH
jgi:hypothetical protein